MPDYKTLAQSIMLFLGGVLFFNLAILMLMFGPWYQLYAMAMFADLFKPDPIGIVLIIWYVPVVVLFTGGYMVGRLGSWLQGFKMSKPLFIFVVLLWVPMLGIVVVTLALLAIGAICFAGGGKKLMEV